MQNNDLVDSLASQLHGLILPSAAAGVTIGVSCRFLHTGDIKSGSFALHASCALHESLIATNTLRFAYGCQRTTLLAVSPVAGVLQIPASDYAEAKI